MEKPRRISLQATKGLAETTRAVLQFCPGTVPHDFLAEGKIEENFIYLLIYAKEK